MLYIPVQALDRDKSIYHQHSADNKVDILSYCESLVLLLTNELASPVSADSFVRNHWGAY